MATAGQYDWLPVGANKNPAQAASVLRGTEVLRLREATLFYVAAEMVELVEAAAQSVPDFQLAPEDLPSDTGLMIFQSPIAPVSIGEDELGVTAVCWARTPARDDVLFGTTYMDRAEAAPIFDRIAPNRQVGRREPRLVYAHGGEYFWPFGDNAGVTTDAANFATVLLPRLRTAWLLMQQPVTSSRDVPLTRPARRRLQRAGHEPADVRLVELRRPAGATPTGDSVGEREYRHRWIVRGHWRQQWYPSRQVHRPVWIAPHLKGPDEAPLLGGEKVNVWKR